MTHNDKGHYSKKHPEGRKINEKLAQAIKEKSVNGEIACAVAHSLAKEFGVAPEEVGFTIDMLEIAIIKCQLGLFGYRPEKKIVKSANEVPANLRKEIENSIIKGKLSCEMAWKIASKLGLKKMDVSAACESLGIKIGHCQLGAF